MPPAWGEVVPSQIVLVRLSVGRIFSAETKGLEALDVPLKMERLWCEDVKYDFVYVDQESFDQYNPTRFGQPVEGFREFKEEA